MSTEVFRLKRNYDYAVRLLNVEPNSEEKMFLEKLLRYGDRAWEIFEEICNASVDASYCYLYKQYKDTEDLRRGYNANVGANAFTIISHRCQRVESTVPDKVFQKGYLICKPATSVFLQCPTEWINNFIKSNEKGIIYKMVIRFAHTELFKSLLGVKTDHIDDCMLFSKSLKLIQLGKWSIVRGLIKIPYTIVTSLNDSQYIQLGKYTIHGEYHFKWIASVCPGSVSDHVKSTLFSGKRLSNKFVERVNLVYPAIRRKSECVDCSEACVDDYPGNSDNYMLLTFSGSNLYDYELSDYVCEDLVKGIPSKIVSAFILKGAPKSIPKEYLLDFVKNMDIQYLIRVTLSAVFLREGNKFSSLYKLITKNEQSYKVNSYKLEPTGRLLISIKKR